MPTAIAAGPAGRWLEGHLMSASHRRPVSGLPDPVLAPSASAVGMLREDGARSGTFGLFVCESVPRVTAEQTYTFDQMDVLPEGIFAGIIINNILFNELMHHNSYVDCDWQLNCRPRPTWAALLEGIFSR